MPLDLKEIQIVDGRDKAGTPGHEVVELRRGDVVAVVGPTGSGKSRLLADIECLAQGDTPSGRHVLINGQAPDESQLAACAGRLVAQLSQNMNFVMDLPVGEFLAMHAECRTTTDHEAAVAAVLAGANELAGEPFTSDVALTQLSGGQSRALMIADAALLSASPVVLIDEIENAGIDRRKALDLLASKDKIVLMSTHDPLLALLGQRRIVIGHGAVVGVLQTTPRERQILAELERIDRAVASVRAKLRRGARLDGSLDGLPENGRSAAGDAPA